MSAAGQHERIFFKHGFYFLPQFLDAIRGISQDYRSPSRDSNPVRKRDAIAVSESEKSQGVSSIKKYFVPG